LVPAQKGLLKLTLRTTGKAGHSAYPEMGTSAIHTLLAALHRLLDGPLPQTDLLGTTTTNVGFLSGGIAANVIAPAAEATVLIRCAAPVDTVRTEIDARLGSDVEVTELSRTDPIIFEVQENSPTGDTVPFNTDAQWLKPLGARLMLMGPGDMRCCHADDEHLLITDLQAGIERYRALLHALSGSVSSPSTSKP
jgi:acetylornithine deacetylase